MADPIDMLELAKRLIPDIETNMPAAVREAFEAGKVKSIFRTGSADLNKDTGLRIGTRGTASAPNSHYFLLDDGRAARYGTDDTTGEFLGKKGSGWMGARASVPNIVMTQDDPFVFDNIFFSKDADGLKIGNNIEEALSKGLSKDPVVATEIYETFSKDGKIIQFHGGNTVKDVYTREGTATFFDDATETPVRGAKPNLITAPINDIEFLEKPGKGFPVQIPKLRSGTESIPTSPPPSTTASGPSLDAIKNAAPDTVTSAGKGRPMVAANYSKMSDEDLLKHYEEVKKQYAEQLIKDPDGKAFMPTARRNLEGTEKQLRARGIHPDDISSSKIKAKVTSEDVVSKPVDEPVTKTAENRVRGSGLNIGTPTDDIRTRPTPKGTDAASRSVVDSGGTRPIINVEPPKPDTIKPPVDKPADVSAKITTDSTSPVKNVPDTSSRITKITSTGRKIKDNGMDVAKNISSGNARTMGIAAIAGLLGAGAYGLNKKKEEDIQSRVNRQRYGEM